MHPLRVSNKTETELAKGRPTYNFEPMLVTYMNNTAKGSFSYDIFRFFH